MNIDTGERSGAIEEAKHRTVSENASAIHTRRHFMNGLDQMPFVSEYDDQTSNHSPAVPPQQITSGYYNSNRIIQETQRILVSNRRLPVVEESKEPASAL